MRTMKRNQQTFWYQLYSKSVPVLDDEGFDTGEKSSGYLAPVKLKGNISPANGMVQYNMFGTLTPYERVIVLDDVNCPIKEDSVLFVDLEPTYTDNVLTNSHNYIVERCAKSLNSISYLIKRVVVK